MDKVYAFLKKRDTRAALGLVTGALIYSAAVVWLLDLGEFYAGGITGVSQLVANFIGYPQTKSLLIALLNVPLFIIGWRGVSKRFAVFSLVSLVLQVLVIAVLDILKLNGFNPFFQVFGGPDGNMDSGSLLTLALLGGLFCGIGQGIALRSGSSTGGLDIISQFLSVQKEFPFVAISLSIDSVIIIASAFVGSLKIAVYTIIRLIITMLVLSQIHTVYNYMKIEIITTKKDEMRDVLIEKFRHGITIYSAYGGYSREQRWVLTTVCSRFEAEEYTHVAKQVDDNVFIIYTAIKRIHGLFFRRVIM
ncbi:MAG: YitT family protein [Bacillota bacterium]|nr:YitT family protein [Bacillota bacterium]NLM31325.1 YitT family protein [Acholeplasmataceae bacterium]